MEEKGSFSVEQLFDFMLPHSTLMSKNVMVRRPFEAFESKLMGSATMFPYKDVKKNFAGEVGPEARRHLHGLGTGTGDAGGLLFNGDKYFTSCGVTSADTLVSPDALEGKSMSVILTRNPFISPARRSTTDVDFFLNYTPSIFASQMVPYLDVELQMIRPPVMGPSDKPVPATNLTSPTMMRFLMGAVPSNSPSLGIAGQVLEAGQTTAGSVKLGKENVDTVVSYSGMEMFMSPQTLTNMDELTGGGGKRLVDVRPFTPFASIEAFDVNVANAGAGAMSHKKGSLRIKLHDKSRMSEMAPFLKPGGHAYVNIITTYGWLAPQGRGTDDIFSNFINEKMRARDRWAVMNSSYAMEPSGQVNIILELVSSGIPQLQGSEVMAQGELKDRLEKFERILESVKAVADAVTKRAPGSDLKALQTIGGIAGRSLPDLQKLGESVKQMLSKLGPGSDAKFDLPAGTFDQLRSDMDVLVKSNKQKNVKSLAEELAAAAKGEARNLFAKLRNQPDPFLSGPKGAAAEDYFSPKYVNHMRDYVHEDGTVSAKLKEGRKVVSFGTVFTRVACEAVLRQETCKELQVIFYGLNDSCGPMSGQSLAEFPIDMERLEYEFAEAIKISGRVTLEGFLRILIDSQFSDKRALAYGMAGAYAKWSPEKSNIENDDKNYDNVMLKWHGDYGSFTQPMVTMHVESGTAADSAGSVDSVLRQSARSLDMSAADQSTRVIKRIHIYDRAATPYDGLQKILNVGGSAYALGDVKPGDDWAIGAEWFREFLQNRATEAVRKTTGGIPGKDPVVSFSPVPGYEEYLINGDRQSIMDHVASFAPTIRPGTNGSLIYNLGLSSKTTGLQGSINILNQNAAYAGQGGVLPPANGLEDPNGMPLRMSPGQLTMQTAGCPVASLYQQYFIDMRTGTTLDNLYTCNTVKHTMVPGKFTTDWTFLYADAYGKFAGAPSLVAAATDLAKKTAAAAAKSPAAAPAAAKSPPAAAPAAATGKSKTVEPKKATSPNIGEKRTSPTSPGTGWEAILVLPDGGIVWEYKG